jgi:hypothetical protein
MIQFSFQKLVANQLLKKLYYFNLNTEVGPDVPSSKFIKEIISYRNLMVRTQIKKGLPIDVKSLNSLVFNVNNINLPNVNCVSIIDSPGSNCPNNGEQILELICKKIPSSSIVVHVADVGRGGPGGSTDEKVLLDLLVDSIQQENAKNNTIRVLFIINKISVVSDKDGELIISDPDEEDAFNTTKAAYMTAFTGMEDKFIGILPMSASNAVLYEGLSIKGSEFGQNITPAQKCSIGQSAIGARFNSLSKYNEREDIIASAIKNYAQNKLF